eukprot:IDg14446t1
MLSLFPQRLIKPTEGSPAIVTKKKPGNSSHNTGRNSTILASERPSSSLGQRAATVQTQGRTPELEDLSRGIRSSAKRTARLSHAYAEVILQECIEVILLVDGEADGHLVGKREGGVIAPLSVM